MWTGRCLATNADGTQCKRRSTLAYWCFEFQGEEFERPTWVETCGHPEHMATRIVAMQDIRWATA